MIYKEYKLQSVGLQHSQYYQGAGVLPEQTWQAVFVGWGESPFSAGEDALEQALSAGWEVMEVENLLSSTSPELDELWDRQAANEEMVDMMQYVVELYLR